MKKILIVTTISGFLTQFEKNDVKILFEQGYEIHYASNFNKRVYCIDEEFLNQYKVVTHHIEIQKSPLKVLKNFKALKQLLHIVKKEDIEIVHCHNPMGGVLGRIAAILQGKKRPFTIYTAHGFHFYKGAPIFNWIFYYTAERFLANYTDILITINEEDYTMANKFNKKNKVYYIPGVGVEIEKFDINYDGVLEKKQELGIPSNNFVIISVGELNDNKNHKTIMKVLHSMKDESFFYGICGSGPLYSELENEIKILGLTEKVKLFGYRTDIPEILQCADCFAFPSKREGFGIAAIEAMAAGVPIIASDCRGTREYMLHEKNGYVCNVDNSNALKKAIIKLKYNNDIRSNMKIECKKQAKKFSIEATGEIMQGIYKQLP